MGTWQLYPHITVDVRQRGQPQLIVELLAVTRTPAMSRIIDTPAWKKAGNTDRWTERLFRALAARVAKRWRFVSFRGADGGEWRGIVDVLAIRKDTSHSSHELLKSGDLFGGLGVPLKYPSSGY